MFEITKDQIKQLKDDELRELISLLSESTLKKHNIETKAVSHGGNQDTKDGGVDIRIKFSKVKISNDFIWNKNTIIQVKVPNMTSSEIRKEMCPNGILRESISELLKCDGCYVIVSSKADVTDIEYTKRLNTMRDCIGNSDKIELEFYDCQKIATWVNQYPGICLWVQEKTGIKIFGWKSYFDCVTTYLSTNNEFIMDDTSFVYKESYDDGSKIPIMDAINEIRNKLLCPKSIIRIAGLSGVGKTRLAFSLFDKKIGTNFLDDSLLLYCDISDNPNPDPSEMIQYIIRMNIRVILIVDNCEKKSHSSLAKYCLSSNSLISLLTIEYDAKEDDVIETTNYYLASSSDVIIRKFLETNYSYISHANIETITECSGGNFRLAKYLATSIDKFDTIGTLNSDELFDRLFMQENKKNEKLLKTAEVCSLLFSFNVNAELELLSKLADISETDLYRNVSILKDMQLAQSRGEMRAILPHALSNKLASDCLKKIKLDKILSILLQNNRVFLSFSRRIKFLHTSAEAKKIANMILTSQDIFNDLKNTSSDNIEILKNICFVIPNEVLNKITYINDRDFFSRENKNYSTIVDILLFLAYEANNFDLVMPLLIKFSCIENINENYNSIRSRLYNLFHIYLSGTHATIEQRISVVNDLLKKSNKVEIELAFKLLDELLQTSDFMGSGYNFGSLKRDYGYQPKNSKDFLNWYQKVISFCSDKIRRGIYKEEIKDILANNFSGLARSGLLIELNDVVKDTLKTESWPEIWISIRYIKHFDKNKIPKKFLKILNDLEELVAPKTLVENYKVYVNNKKRVYINVDDITENYKYLDEKAYNIGKEFGLNMKIFKENFKLFENNNPRNFEFGRGLASNTNNFDKLLKYIIENCDDEAINNNSQLLSGMINEISDNYKKVGEVLDKLLENNKTKKIYPYIQGTYELQGDDINRVIRSFKDNIIPLYSYARITYHLKKLEIKDIVKYLDSIPETKDGLNLKIDVLEHLFSEKIFDIELLDISAKTISGYPFNKDFSRNAHINYEISNVVRVTFTSNRYIEEAIKIFVNLKETVKNEYLSFHDLEDFLKSLINNYPIEFLDIFLDFDSKKEPSISWFLTSSFAKKPLCYIEDDKIIKWLDKTHKYFEILNFIEPFKCCSETKTYEWSELGRFYLKYIEKTIDLKMLEKLIETIYPNSWDETLPDILTSRIFLLQYIIDNSTQDLSEYAISSKIKLIQRIDWEREKFAKDSRERFNSFE